MNPESSTKSSTVSQVSVRMYRQGLGDCFLLTFDRGAAGPFHLLVDCGVFRGTLEAADRMKKVAADIQQETGTKGIDLLVLTHEHWDHLSGFHQASTIFDAIKVDKVWVAWTEDPRNPVARQLKQSQALRLQALTNVATRFGKALGEQNTRTLAEILGFFGGDAVGVKGPQTTRAALEYAMGKGRVDFQVPGEKTIALPELGGVRFYVLGPPENVALLKKSNPSARDSEVYETAARLNADAAFYAATQHSEENYVVSNEDEDLQKRSFPFENNYRVVQEEAEREAFFRENYFKSADAWRRIDGDWLASSEQLALDLDSDTNNTSLALAIELIDSGRILLFPGDAQVGNWTSWGNLSWQVPSADGTTREVTTNDLLSRTVLYKVGHHGSHNATLRKNGLELMTSQDLVAMIPVNETFAQDKPRLWKMPFGPLYQRLVEKTKGRILRADRGWPGEADSKKPAALTASEWKDFLDAVKLENDLYIEFTVQNDNRELNGH